MTLISLEGNIGSGKEKFMQFFKKYFNDDIIFLEDNIYNWNDKTLLANFYKDPKRWAFAVQVHSISQKYKRYLNVLPHKKKGSVIITHRSPMSDKYCFKESCVDSGYMDNKETEIYDGVFDNYKIPRFHGVIYLRSDVNSCYEEIISKGNKTEKGIQFEFLVGVHRKYEEWVVSLKKEGIPVVEIDVEKFRNLDGNDMIQEKLYHIIIEKFPQLSNFSRKRVT